MTACKDRLEAYLREHRVKYETQHHPPAYTSQEVAASEHVPGRMVAKVVMVMVDGHLVELALPAPYRVSLDRARLALGAEEVRLAEEAEFADAFPDCEVGAMPPFGNLYDVPVYVDSSLTEDEVIYFEAGTHTDTMSVGYADFDRLVQPTVADFAEHV
jgi:Ala-tRNA(Pro) deacylase